MEPVDMLIHILPRLVQLEILLGVYGVLGRGLLSIRHLSKLELFHLDHVGQGSR